MELGTMPLRGKDYWIVAVASMEQIIGGALSTVISVILPMMQMTLHPELPSFVQGIIGAMGLVGIGIGSMTIGTISDQNGYLKTFRLCPILIIVGSLICYFFHDLAFLIVGLIIIGIGVGGGYSLDSSYISELLPIKWRLFMVGVAKATCSLGFMGAAVVCVFILKSNPNPHTWPNMILVIGAMGLITLLMRIRWWESPKWLVIKGRIPEAQNITEKFLGKDVQLNVTRFEQRHPVTNEKFTIRKNISKIIFSGIPWACEGLAIYGFSVFLPVLIMALGIDKGTASGIHKIIGSVEITAVVNFFMIPGFVIGLIMLHHKFNNIKMLYTGFVFSAVGLMLLLAAYILKWDVIWMLAGFLIFEVALNSGPHILTFIIPSQVYDVAERGEGAGIAAFIGKVGAIAGVILMPVLLHWGGMVLVLSVSIGVMLLGAAIGAIYGKKLQLT